MNYKDTLFSISPAVEVAYDLHLAASLLRSTCSALTEGRLRQNAIEFENLVGSNLDQPGLWADGVSVSELLKDRALIAPRSEKLKMERHVPISRRLSLVTDFVRNRTNLWDVGRRVSLMVRRGCASGREEYENLMKDLGACRGDFWERYVDFKIGALAEAAGDRFASGAFEPSDCVRSTDEVISEDQELTSLLYPYSGPLVHALKTLACWKSALTSRHFVNLLDALLRLHALTEVHHLANANARLMELLLQASEGTIFSRDDVASRLGPASIEPLTVGSSLLPIMDRTSWQLERSRIFLSSITDIYKRTQSVKSIHLWCTDIAKGRSETFQKALKEFQILDKRGDLDSQIERSSSRNNFAEFYRYVVSQRVTATRADGQFDQSYWARKAGAHRSAKWLISVSPVGGLLFAGLASGGLASCAFREMQATFRSSGLLLKSVAREELYIVLQGLGIAVDSPDGDGGFLVRNPFHVTFANGQA